jgi:peptidoglycan/LPS O-acetylase OafA/YrhL
MAAVGFFLNACSTGVRDLGERPKGNLPILDVLRTAAILMVFSVHSGWEFRASQFVHRFPFFYWGWTGVDLFFILSGLLIGGQLWSELHKTGRIRVGRFLLRRGLRIWPLYFAFVVLILVSALRGARPFEGLYADMLFVSNYLHHQVGGGWSLSTEEQFYIIAPLVISLLSLKLRGERFWIPLSLAFTIPLIARAVAIASSTLSDADLRTKFTYPIHTRSEGLIVGLLIAWSIAYQRSNPILNKHRYAIAASAVLGGIGLYFIRPVLFNFTSLALIYGGLTFGLLGIKPGAVSNWHGFYIGSRLSYGIYLNHFGVLPRFYAQFGWIRQGYGELGFWICYFAALLVSAGLAVLTFCIIESPFLALRSKLLRRDKLVLKASAGATAG